MSGKPVMILVYVLLAAFFLEIAWLFFCAYVKDRHKW